MTIQQIMKKYTFQAMLNVDHVVIWAIHEGRKTAEKIDETLRVLVTQ